ncbi:MAG: SOS response-associated peptidase [Armatimonadetes bacterium]|nr:SOS response-associated peptidase [Armatimonadota bacterium]
MCGRFTLKSTPQAIQKEFNLESIPADYQPRYNIAPTQPVAVIVEEGGGWELKAFKWGLIPFFAREPSMGSRLINARSETVAEKPAFRNAFRHRRCLVPTDGFYEWRQEPQRKIPKYIHREDNAPFAFAGLWERWDGDGDLRIYSCTILTTEANDLMRPIHDRMPVILPESARSFWMDPDADPDALKSLLRPYEGEELEAYTVSTRVNSPRYDGPECIQPAEEEPVLLETGKELNSK